MNDRARNILRRLAKARKIAVVGSRDYPYLGEVQVYIASLPDLTIVVSGGARGVDQMAERVALRRGLGVISFRVIEDPGESKFYVKRFEFNEHGRATGEQFILKTDGERVWFPKFAGAAHYRNELIAREADEGMAFWDGRSTGTLSTINCFAAEHKPMNKQQISKRTGKKVRSWDVEALVTKSRW